jgi:mannose-6-phosphate isomerase-like protein (cupin superfamily)
MERVGIDSVDRVYGPAAEKRRLTGPLGATNLAITYYELAPGDAFAFGFHRHADQEEVFVVESGTVTFETEAGPVEVAAGEAIRFAPGEFQRGRNRGTERVRAVAIGAPQDAGETEIRRTCADCDERTPQTIERAPDGADGLVTRCLDCSGVTGRFVHGEVDREGT